MDFHNISNINIINTGTINASIFSGDGSQLNNLNAISSLSLQSTVQGLGTFAYISSLSLQSTITGLGTFAYISSLSLQSTITGLGTFSYVSSLSLQSTVEGLGTTGYVSSLSNWSLYPAISNVNMNTFSIINVDQTNTSNSAATNIIGRRVYFDKNTTFNIDNITYSNVLNTSPTNYLTFMYPNNFYNYLNCTFSFRCDDVKDDLAYYFRLSNNTQPTILNGEIFSDVYPYLETQHNILTSNHSITVQEQFDISTWSNNDNFIPMMYVKTKTGAHTMNNMKFSMVYEPLI
jgi:hypothetical protein